VRNLPAGVAGSTLHPPIAVPFGGLQGEPEHGVIGLAAELTLRRTAVADLQRIVPDAVIGEGLAEVLGRAHALRLPESFPEIAPRDLHVGIRLHDPAIIGMLELLGRVVSEAHASVGITLDVYSHVLPSMSRTAADAIEAVLGE
jgi:hypothetical protein